MSSSSAGGESGFVDRKWGGGRHYPRQDQSPRTREDSGPQFPGAEQRNIATRRISSIEDEIEAALGRVWGRDKVMDMSTGKDLPDPRVDHRTPQSTSARAEGYQASKGRWHTEALTWEVYR